MFRLSTVVLSIYLLIYVQVKHGGPIVYSGEKPPIIHFPPPPEVNEKCLNIFFITKTKLRKNKNKFKT